MPNKVSTVLVGLGKIGVGYDLDENVFRKGQTYTHLKSILENEKFYALAIIDTNPQVLKQINSLVNITSGTEILLPWISKKFELLVIACPTSKHLKVLKDASKAAKFNYLLIEKPVGASKIECFEIQEITKSQSIEVYVNYFRRYLRSTNEVKAFLNSIQKGAFLSAQIKSYGTLANIFSHFIDLGIEITGADIFCACPKISQSNNPGNVVLHCYKCNSQITLIGINDSPNKSEVVLNFERIEIRIINNGFDFVVWNKFSDIRLEFKSTPYEIANYQQLVYSKISAVLGKPNSISGLDQALSVHGFLDSVYSSYG